MKELTLTEQKNINGGLAATTVGLLIIGGCFLVGMGVGLYDSYQRHH